MSIGNYGISREIMKDTPYNIIPLHHRPELMNQCCKLLNSEWRRSEKARLISLSSSCDKFPTSLVLLDNDKVIGHCKISLIPSIDDCCVIESFMISRDNRSQGLGSILLRGVEQYVAKRGIKQILLTTRDQEGFYRKNGYSISEPLNLYKLMDYMNSINESDKEKQINLIKNIIIEKTNERRKELKTQQNNAFSGAPPPPPLPNLIEKKRQYESPYTYMCKKLS
ncbi:N-alpha-acetyltransferase 80 [Leptopilina boulardi]|uniref:N-alpha-acetyltransferase 80 n=1 Tax=Leptopilina boulardi TaxID=63433 RepID=UPI0021F5AE35|nr:N-alpha-acetyltransferase 80 [Leptopilina boulardi]